MKTTNNRQGDVLLESSSIPEDAQKIAPRPIAFGETTGHSHRLVDIEEQDMFLFKENISKNNGQYIPKTKEEWNLENKLLHAPLSENVTMYQTADGTMYLKIDASVILVHEDHANHLITPDTILYTPQFEYTPQGLRNVAD